MSGRQGRKDPLDLITLGLFLLLVGVIFIITPDLLDKAYDFFRDIELVELYSDIYLPAPKSDHPVLFKALSRFCFYFAVLQIPVLAVRFILKDPAEKKAGGFSGLLFWFGAAWIIDLSMAEDTGWFTFLGYLIALIGICIVAKNALILGSKAFRKP